MGLAASQMRFLALTAKKSNCEYQGQQINQQRLNLANQSSSIYSTIADLSVPIPPNSANFSSAPAPAINRDVQGLKTLHNALNSAMFEVLLIFSSGSQADMDSKLQQLFTGNMGNGRSAAATASLAQAGHITSEEVAALRQAWQETVGIHNTGGSSYNVSKNELYDEFMTRAFGAGNYISSAQYMAMETSFNGVPAEQLMNVWNNQYNSWLSNYKYVPATYEQAYAQYEADLVYYNARMAALEAESANVHQKDKKLELQLKRIDTEHSAISTELDTVKKILDDNIESSFKTFS